MCRKANRGDAETGRLEQGLYQIPDAETGRADDGEQSDDHEGDDELELAVPVFVGGRQRALREIWWWCVSSHYFYAGGLFGDVGVPSPAFFCSSSFSFFKRSSWCLRPARIRLTPSCASLNASSAR